MARTAHDLEAFLMRLERRFEHLDDGSYVVSAGPGMPPVVVRIAPPLVLLRVDIGPAPTGTGEGQAALYRRLLELNARDLVHAAYGLAGATIVLTAALALDNLDLNEIEETLADIDLALATHTAELRELAQAK